MRFCRDFRLVEKLSIALDFPTIIDETEPFLGGEVIAGPGGTQASPAGDTHAHGMHMARPRPPDRFVGRKKPRCARRMAHMCIALQNASLDMHMRECAGSPHHLDDSW